MPEIASLSCSFFAQYASTSLRCDACEERPEATVKIRGLVTAGYSRSAGTWLGSLGTIESTSPRKLLRKGRSSTASENLERLWNLPVEEKPLQSGKMPRTAAALFALASNIS